MLINRKKMKQEPSSEGAVHLRIRSNRLGGAEGQGVEEGTGCSRTGRRFPGEHIGLFFSCLRLEKAERRAAVFHHSEVQTLHPLRTGRRPGEPFRSDSSESWGWGEPTFLISRTSEFKSSPKTMGIRVCQKYSATEKEKLGGLEPRH